MPAYDPRDVIVSTENYKLFISTKGMGKKMAKRLTEKEEPEISKINKWNVIPHIIKSQFGNKHLKDITVMQLNTIIKMSVYP